MATNMNTELTRFVWTQLRVAEERLHPGVRLLQDLGVDGDDGTEFITAFAQEFGVDLAEFRPDRHFGPEAAWNPLSALWRALAGSDAELVPITLADLQAAILSGTWVNADSTCDSELLPYD